VRQTVNSVHPSFTPWKDPKIDRKTLFLVLFSTDLGRTFGGGSRHLRGRKVPTNPSEGAFKLRNTPFYPSKMPSEILEGAKNYTRISTSFLDKILFSPISGRHAFPSETPAEINLPQKQWI